jgi:hypothetical protein
VVKRALLIVLTIACSCRTPPAPVEVAITRPVTARQGQALIFVDYLEEIFREEYALAEHKAAKLQWRSRPELDRVRAEIMAEPDLDLPKLHRALRRFFRSPADIHLGIGFDGDHHARWLGVQFRRIGDEVLVAWVDRSALPPERFPFSPGDRLVRFDGMDPPSALAQVGEATHWRSTPAFERSFADWFLTVRAASDWPEIPAPESTLELEIAGAAGPKVVTLPWLDMQRTPPSARCPLWGKTLRGFLPLLGEPIWQGGALLPAYVFELDGQRIGYLRVSTYNYGEADRTRAIAELDRAIDAFAAHEVGKLVWDQTGNGGGNFLFGYALLSRLTDRELLPPLQHYLINRASEVAGFGSIASLEALAAELDAVQTEAEAKRYFEATAFFRRGLNFMPYDTSTIRGLAGWLSFFAEQGIPTEEPRLTEPHYSVTDRIRPLPTKGGQRYTGAIVALVDELNISAAEFVAATLKDNHRATLFGVTTAGAGGDQRTVHRERICGMIASDLITPCAPVAIAEVMTALRIESFSYTVTVGRRRTDAGKLLGPIENVGVEPDVHYELCAEDLRTGYAAYAEKLRTTLRALK